MKEVARDDVEGTTLIVGHASMASKKGESGMMGRVSERERKGRKRARASEGKRETERIDEREREECMCECDGASE